MCSTEHTRRLSSKVDSIEIFVKLFLDLLRLLEARLSLFNVGVVGKVPDQIGGLRPEAISMSSGIGGPY